MLRPTITYEQAVNHLPSYAHYYPDRTTTNFDYFDDQLRPVCIVAHLLEAFGADTRRIYRLINGWPTVRVLADDYGVFYADKATLDLLTRIQELEDEGYTWQDAIEGGLNNDKPRSMV